MTAAVEPLGDRTGCLMQRERVDCEHVATRSTCTLLTYPARNNQSAACAQAVEHTGDQKLASAAILHFAALRVSPSALSTHALFVSLFIESKNGG